MLRAIVQLLKILTIGVTALLVATGGARVFDLAIDRATPDDIGEEVAIEINEDEDVDAVATKLADAGLIRSKLLFTGQMRITGGSLKPGKYTLAKGMTVEQMIDRVSGVEPQVAQAEEAGDDTAADTGAGETVSVTIPEGRRIEEIAEISEEAGIEGGYDGFLQAVKEVDRSQYDFLADLPPNASLEGFLFPNTYDFVKDDPGYNVAQLLNGFDAQVTQEMRDRAKAMNLSLHEVITFASIIEREARVPDERPIIADVYLNRYSDPDFPGGLEADPTTQYEVGTREEWWPDLNENKDLLETPSPYNTYKNRGLPPGPICNPGFASIQAVLFPGGTNNYFFVATGDEAGTHYFAETWEEHQENVRLYTEAVADQ
ncbi:MAG: FIG004453: protein YceG like [uncultured Thermomicrobiales bacterium]|uniref:Endolytic murein transglycosylase n=1 Tax=uncultured Thermomicrobiales bacterium TaxID=1645740 RepID=A0A6J4USP0_9BACT|nr:MAG: FIG004453: protein YceG like [uncultured Thermomicrobiales bacterium]